MEDRKRLNANLTHGINTIIISPRRWGKTSLVKKVLNEIDDDRFLTVFIDVFRCKSEYEFYRNFATCVIKQTSTKIDEWIETTKLFLSSITPKFSFGTDPLNDFSLSFEWNERNDSEEEILSLPQRIAAFDNTGKTISVELAERICRVASCQSSYVQQLAWITWYKTETTVTDKIVDLAVIDLLEQNKTFFQREMEQLTELQFNFMQAVADGISKGFSRKEVLRKYHLESSANIQAIKKAMMSKDLIYTDDDGNIQFNDPLFCLWVKRT